MRFTSCSPSSIFFDSFFIFLQQSYISIKNYGYGSRVYCFVHHPHDNEFRNSAVCSQQGYYAEGLIVFCIFLLLK